MQADNEFEAKLALHSETLPRNQENFILFCFIEIGFLSVALIVLKLTM